MATTYLFQAAPVIISNPFLYVLKDSSGVPRNVVFQVRPGILQCVSLPDQNADVLPHKLWRL